MPNSGGSPPSAPTPTQISALRDPLGGLKGGFPQFRGVPPPKINTWRHRQGREPFLGVPTEMGFGRMGISQKLMEGREIWDGDLGMGDVGMGSGHREEFGVWGKRKGKEEKGGRRKRGNNNREEEEKEEMRMKTKKEEKLPEPPQGPTPNMAAALPSHGRRHDIRACALRTRPLETAPPSTQNGAAMTPAHARCAPCHFKPRLPAPKMAAHSEASPPASKMAAGGKKGARGSLGTPQAHAGASPRRERPPKDSWWAGEPRPVHLPPHPPRQRRLHPRWRRPRPSPVATATEARPEASEQARAAQKGNSDIKSLIRVIN